MRDNPYLHKFIEDPEDPISNFNLAIKYYNINQTAAAVSFFLRCAERTLDKNLAYECMIHIGDCFASQGKREEHTKYMYQVALNILPKRYEAYYKLVSICIEKKDFITAHNHCSVALEICDFESPKFKFDNGDYRDPKVYFLFEQGHSAWWNGQSEKAASIFYNLKKNYILEKQMELLVDQNLEKISETTEWHDPLPYTPQKYQSLRYKFDGSEKLVKNYAQVYQDLFVLSMLNGKRTGSFLEVGGARPWFGNNTALLETEFDWRGVSIEFNKNFAEEYRGCRYNTTMICSDATKINYTELLNCYYASNVVDYLQLDIDPPNATYEVLLKIPFEEYKFGVITYEHDYYADPTKSYREKSRNYLESKGYVLVADNISPDDKSPFEDWWVHPDLVDIDILNAMKLVDGKTKFAEDYMFPNNTQQIIDVSPIKEEKVVDSSSNSEIPTFSVNKTSMKNTVWTVDNFYEDPDAVREFALKQTFVEGGWGNGFIGRRTKEQFLFPGLKEKFEEIIGQKITKWEEHGMNGRFQNAVGGEPLAYHCDAQKWGGMLYLTPNAPFQCGTTLYAHKKTRARNYFEDGWGDAWADESKDIYPGGNHCDGTHFEPVDVVGNVYNRLVIFDASCIHSASEYFGSHMENGRLWQMFFFDT